MAAERITPRRMSFAKGLIILAMLVAILYAVLLIPDPSVTLARLQRPADTAPFAWKQDAFWDSLEIQSVEARGEGCSRIAPRIALQMLRLQALLTSIAERQRTPDDLIFRQLELAVFKVAPLISACPDSLAPFIALVAQVRKQVKRQSRVWDMNTPVARATVYRLLYGGRAAVEELMLQVSADKVVSSMTLGTDVSSSTPWTTILGVVVHSGDILVSRGGAPTSALIARGNDFAGNFSHVALVYVDPETRLAQIIESHIERGVTVSSLDAYFKDTKLRVMILRLRSDIPVIQSDPMLPHRVAAIALQRASRRHIPYDFEMDYRDTLQYFCSEVASDSYRTFGINLWMGLSHISTEGLQRWLAGFGVRYFETQEPSDLEYDPQLEVVAEWRDRETLRKDHYDNAVTEVMLEGAERGDELRYSWLMLPFARVLKGYSGVLNRLGREGPVPEGMTATAALRHTWYVAQHAAINERLKLMADRFRRERGYEPPYWQLVRLANVAKAGLEAGR